MATGQECELALRKLTATIARAGDSGDAAPERSVSCQITDLGLMFAGRLRDGRLQDIARSDPAGSAGSAKANASDIRLTTTSDDLIKLVDGSLGFATAWSSGRLRVDASIRDLLRLRKML